jgi:hypothetical protein
MQYCRFNQDVTSVGQGAGNLCLHREDVLTPYGECRIVKKPTKVSSTLRKESFTDGPTNRVFARS